MPEKKVRMSVAVNWQAEIGVIAGPFEGNRKSWLARAARRASVSYRQVKALYYGETTNPRHNVATSVLTAAEQARLEETRRDALKVAEFCARRAEALAVVDAEFHQPEIDAFVAAARFLSRRDNA